MKTAVLFGYHDVGTRTLRVLLDRGVRVALVVTHQDSARENIFFDSVADLARLHDIPVVTPADPNDPALFDRVRDARPDLIFSAYYRHLIPTRVLDLAPLALNIHGSLLPKYRGRAPVNWAILRGERETGVTLHKMVALADAGAIADQFAVPILGDDTAADVFAKLTTATELLLTRALPRLLDGRVEWRPNPRLKGQYFGGRTPADGEIKPGSTTRQIHDLVRAVAPPFPGAFLRLSPTFTLHIDRTLVEPAGPWTAHHLAVATEGDRAYLQCESGRRLRLVTYRTEGKNQGDGAGPAGVLNVSRPWEVA